MTEIAGRVAVVTGGGSGIGKVVAQELAREGAAVVVADIILDNAKQVADAITASGGRAIAVMCDVCERDSIRRMKAEANAAFGLVTLVVPNAGATCFERLTDMSDADVDWILQVNLMGVTYTIRTFLPDMIAAKKGGHILSTASMAGMLPGWVPLHAPYSAAKMGIIGLSFNLGLELAEHDIMTSVYCPGGVATGMKDNNERYRPQRFGGPGPGPVRVPSGFFVEQKTTFLSPEQIAPMVIKGIKNNRKIVFDHSDQRRLFVDTYQQYVMQAFDDAEAYEKTMGADWAPKTPGHP